MSAPTVEIDDDSRIRSFRFAYLPRIRLSRQEGQINAAAFDQARMHDLEASIGDGLSEVIEVYLEDTPNVLRDMQAALDRGDWQELQRLAHSLKSSSGIFGAQEMVALCKALEACTEVQLPRCEKQIQAVAQEFDRLNQDLSAYLHK